MIKQLFAAVLLAFLIVLAQTSNPSLSNASQGDIFGHAWSSNIGWISFSGIAADGSAYGVKLDPASNEFSGYAWSPNIGWISFEKTDLTGCPAAPCIAETTQTGGVKKITGWLKVLSTNSWVSLSGKAADGTSYEVKINPQGKLSGYAWENTIVGWINFKGVAADGSDYGVSTKPLTATCYFFAQPASVPEFSKTALYWDCQNVKSCSIDGTTIAAKGSKEITMGKGNSLYTLSCIGLDDSTKNYPVTIKTIKPGIKEVKP